MTTLTGQGPFIMVSRKMR